MTDDRRPDGRPDSKPDETRDGKPEKLRALLARHGLHAKKSWSQNFLHDQKALDDIARAVGAPSCPVNPGDWVVEAGSGPGNLTRALLARDLRVYAVEPDPGFVTLLHEEYAREANEGRFEIFDKEAQSVDFAAIAARNPSGRVWLAGNLPYQVASAIIFHAASARAHLGGMVVMIQREMADRLMALPGSRVYGAPTAKLGLLFRIERVRHVAAGSFTPRPNVDSTVLRLVTLDAPAAPVPSVAAYMQVVAWCFEQRRKTLFNNLKATGLAPEALTAVLNDVAIAPSARAETLSVADFARLTSALHTAGVRPISAR